MLPWNKYIRDYYSGTSAEKSDASCSVILLPMAITFYITWGFISFVDGFFSPIYNQLGIDIFGKQIFITLFLFQRDKLLELLHLAT